MVSKENWIDDIKQVNIGDFTKWKNLDEFKKSFDKLVKSLKSK